MLRAVAALSALVLLPSLGTAAPTATPAPRATPTAAEPCGYVSFIPAGAPRMTNGTAYERVKAIVRFSDSHTETAEFPYPWVYPNGEQTDPWSDTNLRKPDFATPMQLPPAGTDVKTFAPVLQYVVAHTTANGYTTLRPCSTGRNASGVAPASPDPARIPAAAANAPMWLTFVDDTPRDAPVTIVDATMYALDPSRSIVSIVRECVTFWNRSARTVAAIRFAFSYFDAAGNPKTIQPLDRFGSFAPGVVVEGVRRGHAPRNVDSETLKNCRTFLWSGETGVNRVAVTAVEFADHSTWPPGSASVWPVPAQ
jgi:hypothetical protein